MPPTWDKAEHYGFDVFVHYGIGADNNRYLCLSKHKGEPCPVCEEQAKANREGDEEYAKKLRANTRVGVWAIDRDDEKRGPQVYLMPKTMDTSILAVSRDKRSGETYFVDDPENGYDVEFDKEGKAEKTRYLGVRLARKSTPLSDDQDQADKWLDFIKENPIPDVLNFFSADHIQLALTGSKTKSKGEEEDEDEERPRQRVRTRDDGRAKGKRDDDEDEEEIDDEDEDLDEKPRKKTKPEPEDEEDDEDRPARSRKRSRDQDEEDEEDEKPRKKTKPEPEDEEDSEDDEDEDDEEPVAKKSSRKRSREQDDEDEQEPRPRRPPYIRTKRLR